MEAVILVAIRLLVYLCVTMSIDYDEKEKESIFVVAEGVLYRSSLTILHGWLCRRDTIIQSFVDYCTTKTYIHVASTACPPVKGVCVMWNAEIMNPRHTSIDIFFSICFALIASCYLCRFLFFFR